MTSSQTTRIGSWIAILACLIVSAANAQQPKLRATVGAYYFDGWSGKTNDIHLPKLLETKYADRKPVWGWTADTVEIMQKQIDYCADHDIAFWAFDWYYPEGKDKTTPLNNALGLYLKAPNSPAIEVLPARGKPCWVSDRAEGLGRLLRDGGSNCSGSRRTFGSAANRC